MELLPTKLKSIKPLHIDTISYDSSSDNCINISVTAIPDLLQSQYNSIVFPLHGNQSGSFIIPLVVNSRGKTLSIHCNCARSVLRIRSSPLHFIVRWNGIAYIRRESFHRIMKGIANLCDDIDNP